MIYKLNHEIPLDEFYDMVEVLQVDYERKLRAADAAQRRKQHQKRQQEYLNRGKNTGTAHTRRRASLPGTGRRSSGRRRR